MKYVDIQRHLYFDCTTAYVTLYGARKTKRIKHLLLTKAMCIAYVEITLQGKYLMHIRRHMVFYSSIPWRT